MRSARPIFPQDPAWELAPRVVERHVELERDVLRMVLSAPAQAVPVARRFGVSSAVFTDDLSHIWQAAEETYTRGIEPVLLAAADELALNGYWRATARRDDWQRFAWSLAGLASFATSWADRWHPFTGHCLGIAAKELNRVHMLLRRADTLRRDSLRALEDASYPQSRRGSVRKVRVLSKACARRWHVLKN